jgi:hypothetical protein
MKNKEIIKIIFEIIMLILLTIYYIIPYGLPNSAHRALGFSDLLVDGVIYIITSRLYSRIDKFLT